MAKQVFGGLTGQAERLLRGRKADLRAQEEAAMNGYVTDKPKAQKPKQDGKNKRGRY